ncbi:hypothetical protein [Lutibacter maritimus]|uniref:Uncharacterized protein n=1 Tax=Lutibacter maritimus TaxID=593133 RepID=A0A1I6SX01_9FLAO|nr:hypothetical protein [Lutibacter maritimus]SFS81328.1 hypothetical protein SAMN04488006_0172 [Lutibacter maritimus]
MSKIKNFLSDFDDYELAFFAKFKLNTYLKNSQENIEKILFKRGLTKYRIEQLIKNNPKSKLADGKERCPRCYSDKIRNDKVELTNTSSGFGLSDKIATYDGMIGKATYKDEIICNVCGFWLKDPNEEKPKSLKTNLFRGIMTIIIGFFRG